MKTDNLGKRNLFKKETPEIRQQLEDTNKTFEIILNLKPAREVTVTYPNKLMHAPARLITKQKTSNERNKNNAIHIENIE